METFKEKNAPLRQPEAAEAERDEALFHSLQKRKQAKKRRTTRRVIILLLTAAVCPDGGSHLSAAPCNPQSGIKQRR